MPDKYYSIKGKNYEIFMLDTNLDLFNEKTIMKQFKASSSEKIKNSNKKWKIVWLITHGDLLVGSWKC